MEGLVTQPSSARHDAVAAGDRIRTRSIVFAVALVVVVLSVTVAFLPGLPTRGIDASWMYALNQAVAQELAFGRDVLFAFGPYASLYTHRYHPGTSGLMFWGGFALALAFAHVAWRHYRDAHWCVQVPLLVCLACATVSPDALYYFYALMAGTYAFRASGAWADAVVGARGAAGGDTPAARAFFVSASLSRSAVGQRGASGDDTSAARAFRASALLLRTAVGLRGASSGDTSAQDLRERSRVQAYTLAAIFAPLGLLPLIKGAALASVVVVLAGSLALFALRRAWCACAIVALSPVVTLLLLWVVARQPLSALPDYVAGTWTLLRGYSEAMSVSGRGVETMVFGVCALALTGGLVAAVQARPLRRALLTAMWAGVLWLAFKEGFVRHDTNHVAIARLTLALSATLACTLPFAVRPTRRLGVSLLLCLLMMASFARLDVARRVVNSMVAVPVGLAIRIGDPKSFAERFEARVDAIRLAMAFPYVTGTADIYSWDQTDLIASGNRWHPRPVLQSHAAYTASLALRDRDWLAGRQGPDNVFFSVQPIDDRLPSLEDGASWPALVLGYRVARVGRDMLLLERKSQQPIDATARTRTLATSTAALGEPVHVPAAQGLVMAKVDVRLSPLGRLADALFKPGQLDIAVPLRNGDVRTYRYVARMGQAGFLISPLVASTADFGKLYGDDPAASAEGAVRSFCITPRGWAGFWQPTYAVTLVAVDPSTPPSTSTTSRRSSSDGD